MVGRISQIIDETRSLLHACTGGIFFPPKPEAASHTLSRFMMYARYFTLSPVRVTIPRSQGQLLTLF